MGLLAPLTVFSSGRYRPDSVSAGVSDTKCIGIAIPPHNNMTKRYKTLLSLVAKRTAKPATK